MKHLFYTWKLGCLLLLILAGCSSKKSVSSYHSFESECLGVELDGSETLRAWGRGKNRTDAIEQAKKNAVRDVLFKGVVAGSRECSVRPLITEVNAQERYASYFNDFFSCLLYTSSVLVSFLFGAIVFREKNLKSKAVDLALVLIGMIFLYLGSR